MPGTTSPSTTRIAGADGVGIAVHHWGGDGPPVLLAHPTGFHGRIWAPVAQRLVEARHRVWSFDFRGHGDSDAPDGDYSWHGFASDVLAVTDHLGIAGDPDLLAAGHSKGAASLLLAEVERPATFPFMWLFEPIVLPFDEPQPANHDNPLSLSARRRRDAWRSIADAYAAFSSKPPLNVMSEESLRAYVDYAFRDRGDGVLVLKCRPENESKVYAQSSTHGVYARLGEIASVTRVAVGETTDAISEPIARMIVDRLRNGSLEVMPGLGHFGPQQDPDATVASMLAFERSVRPT